jgi:hypothetical protein
MVPAFAPRSGRILEGFACRIHGLSATKSSSLVPLQRMIFALLAMIW